MAENIEVVLTLNDRNFTRKAAAGKAAIGGLGGAAVGASASFTRMLGPLALAASGIVAVTAGFKGLKGALNVSQEFETIEKTLSNLTGSAAKGRAAMDQLVATAEELPIAFDELAGATPALATISPTLADLQRNTQLAADIAGQFGISFQDAAGQLQRAFSGGIAAADIFREKGVKSAAGFEEGVSYSVDETIAKLREFGGEIEGAAQSLNTTLAGSVSQAGDAFTLFQKEVGDSIKPEFKGAVDALVQAYRNNKEEVMAFARAIGENVVKAFFAFGDAIALVMDILSTLGQTFKMVFNGIKQIVGPFFQEFFDLSVKVLGFLIEQIAYVGIGFGKLLELLPGVDATVTDFFTNVQNAAKKARENGLDAFTESAEDLFDQPLIGNRYREAFNQFEETVKSSAETTRQVEQEVAASAENISDTTIDIAKNFGNAGTEIKTFADLLKELKLQFAEIETLAEYEVAVGKLKEMFNQGTISLEEFKRAKAALDQVFAEGNEPLANFASGIEDLSKGISDNLANAIMTGESFMDGLKDTFKRVITQMIADSFRLKVIQPILAGIFGGSFGAGGYTPGTGGMLGSMISGLFKASGGPVMANQPYIVGEKGAEAFVPGVSGTIIPNEQLGGMGGSQVTYNISAVDARSFKQMVAQDPEFIYSVTQAGRRRLPI